MSNSQPFGSPVDGYPEQSQTGSGLNSPDLNPKTGKARRRAITDEDHIFRIIGDLQMSRRDQNQKNGRIQGKLNSERPYQDDQLESENLGYKSNFSTKPLSTTVGKVSSRLTKAIQASRFLTAAELPDSIPDAKKKTELFRTEITNMVRRWPGWYNFVNETAQEDAVFGWATIAWLDTQTWRPTFFRQDKAFLPDGTKQTVDSFQFGAFEQPLMPHELADLVGEDFEAARLAGWDTDEVAKSINAARPPAIPSSQAAPYTDTRRLEDALRESSVSLSLTSGAKQIMLWHVLATEIDGRVSHYIGDGNSKRVLFRQEDRFENIQDALAFLSYEQAATLMGSKGIGREVYELANVLDRARNETVDRLQLSGKVFVQGPENQIARFKLHVLGNVAVIPEGFTITQTKIESGVEEFIALDRLLTGLLDQIAGGVTPRDFERERVTKAEVDLYAEREEEKRDDITTRFITQFGAIISTIQRRAMRPECADRDAKEAREKLLNFMPEDELRQISETPALRTIEDFTMLEQQKIVAFASEVRTDPLYNQSKLARRKAEALFGPEFAEEVVMAENDPTQAAEQSRQQQLENVLLERGEPVAVSPRDAHEIHVPVVKQLAGGLIQNVAQQPTPEALAVLEGVVKHWGEHVAALGAGAFPKDQLKALEQEVTEAAKLVGELQGQIQAHQEQQAKIAQTLATDPAAGAQMVAQAQQPPAAAA